jgi:hypothetical protein
LGAKARLIVGGETLLQGSRLDGLETFLFNSVKVDWAWKREKRIGCQANVTAIMDIPAGIPAKVIREWNLHDSTREPPLTPLEHLRRGINFVSKPSPDRLLPTESQPGQQHREFHRLQPILHPRSPIEQKNVDIAPDPKEDLRLPGAVDTVNASSSVAETTVLHGDAFLSLRFSQPELFGTINNDGEADIPLEYLFSGKIFLTIDWPLKESEIGDSPNFAFHVQLPRDKGVFTRSLPSPMTVAKRFVRGMLKSGKVVVSGAYRAGRVVRARLSKLKKAKPNPAPTSPEQDDTRLAASSSNRS